MLKLEQNFIPDGIIDGINTEYKTDKIIGTIQSIYVDGTLVNGYTSNILTITLDVAPITSIVVNYFYRELSSLRGNGEVTLGKLKDDFYRKIGRVNSDGTVPINLNKLYPEDYVKEQLRKSIKRYSNKSPSRIRIQQYSFKSLNGYTITSENQAENTMTFEQKLTNEIEGMFILKDGIAYEYYGLSGSSFKTADVDLSEIGDKMIVGHRIPYGVEKISEVIIDGEKYKWIDERDFNMNLSGFYTIIRDFQGNDYLFLPYSEESRTYSIKYIPELGDMSDDNDILDIPEEYTDLFVYDVAYKLMRDKEDERWALLKDEIGTGKRQGLLFEYQSFIKSKINKSKAQIGFAKT